MKKDLYVKEIEKQIGPMCINKKKQCKKYIFSAFELVYGSFNPIDTIPV